MVYYLVSLRTLRRGNRLRSSKPSSYENRKLFAMAQAELKQINNEELPQVDNSSDNISKQESENKDSQSDLIKLRRAPEKWTPSEFESNPPSLPVTKEKAEKSINNKKVIRGFKLYYTEEGGVLLQIGFKYKIEENSKLITSIKMFFSRVLGKDIQFIELSDWECPCQEVTHLNVESTEEISRWLAFENYNPKSLGDKGFLDKFFHMVHSRMKKKNFEIPLPSGLDVTEWILRDLLRYLGRLKFELLENLINRIPKKERKIMEFKFHDFEKFKSVLSEQEWKLITDGALDESLKECQTVKSSIIKFKQYSYSEFAVNNAKNAVTIFGKPCIAMIYERIKERNSLRVELLKRKDSANVNLAQVLSSLRLKNMYAGIHLLPVILKFREGDLPEIQKLTILEKGELKPNDSRFANIEEYLKFAMNNPIRGADARRIVDVNLSLEQFPRLDKN